MPELFFVYEKTLSLRYKSKPMRYLFLLILLLIGIKNYANDTLTRAEVYDCGRYV